MAKQAPNMKLSNPEANDLGARVGDIMKQAVTRANKMLKPYGYSATVDLKFHQLKQGDKTKS